MIYSLDLCQGKELLMQSSQWQMQEKYECKGKKLCFAFVDLEKTFDRVPREVTRWALRKAGVEEWLVMHRHCQTVV